MRLIDADIFVNDDRACEGIACKECPFHYDDGCKRCDFIQNYPTAPAIPIPENATNGDIIKALFSNVKWWVNEDNEVFTDHETINSNRVAINADWWNSPYKRGETE